MKTEKQVDNLQKQILISRRQRETSRLGIVEAVSLQGDKLYFVVREIDFAASEEDKLKVIKGQLFGNITELPEDEITLADVLIETDVNCSTTYFEPEHFIGQVVEVVMVQHKPILVIVRDSGQDARVISREDLLRARATNDDHSIDHKDAIKYLKNVGYSDKVIKKVLSEKVSSLNINGRILTYGDRADWTRSSSNNSDPNTIDLSDSVKGGIVTGLPSASLANHICYKPPIALTGK